MTKQKINFRGKDLNLLEARIYQICLKIGVIPAKLDEKENRIYEVLKKMKGGKFSEKDYLIDDLGKQIGFAKGPNYMTRKSLEVLSRENTYLSKRGSSRFV